LHSEQYADRLQNRSFSLRIVSMKQRDAVRQSQRQPIETTKLIQGQRTKMHKKDARNQQGLGEDSIEYDAGSDRVSVNSYNGHESSTTKW